MLLKKKADITIPNDKEQNALQIALDNRKRYFKLFKFSLIIFSLLV
jgi:hypothetical protein